jgi:hypothetical protein
MVLGKYRLIRTVMGNELTSNHENLRQIQFLTRLDSFNYINVFGEPRNASYKFNYRTWFPI